MRPPDLDIKIKNNNNKKEIWELFNHPEYPICLTVKSIVISSLLPAHIHAIPADQTSLECLLATCMLPWMPMLL